MQSQSSGGKWGEGEATGRVAAVEVTHANGGAVAVPEDAILYQNVRRVVLDGDVIVTAGEVAAANRDVVCGQQALLVLQGAIPRLTVRADPTNLEVATLLHRHVTVVNRAVDVRDTVAN